MCGIIGYIGQSDAVDVLHYGLKKLEYRGYDSAGIAVVSEKIKIFKKAGNVDNLFKSINIASEKNNQNEYAKINENNGEEFCQNNNEKTSENNCENLNNATKKTNINNENKKGIILNKNNGQNKCKIDSQTKIKIKENTHKNKEKFCANIGIAHTRWATHGKATDKNSHPHKSRDGEVVIVHNGIIENYKELKEKYFKFNHFESETDTEVVANLIAYYEKKYDNKIEAILMACKEIKGSYAFAIIFNSEKDKIYFTKNQSPLVVGKNKNDFFVSSDLQGFWNKAEEFFVLNDNQIGFISPSQIKIFSENLTEIQPKFLPMPKEQTHSDMGSYPFYMIKEISEIPFVIKNTVLSYQNDKILEKIPKKFFSNLKKIIFVSCGTSYHASLVGKLLLQEIDFDANCEIASEFIYAKQKIDKNTLCIFISQSGETADTLSAIKISKKLGAKTLGITNVKTSTITTLCDHILPMECGTEIAVASTKVYNVQLVVLILLSQYLFTLKHAMVENYSNIIEMKNEAQNQIENDSEHQCIRPSFNIDKNKNETLNNLLKLEKDIDIKYFEKQIQPLVKEVVNSSCIFFVGRQFDYVSSMESALKLKEISYLNCQGYASGELKHGALALVDEKTIIFAFITQFDLIDKTLNIVEQAKSRGAKICVISQFEQLKNNAKIDYFIALPKCQDCLMPIVSIIPMQLLAYNTSVVLGHNPDKPRNLAKSVTVE